MDGEKKVSVLNDRDIVKEVPGFDVGKKKKELEEELRPVMSRGELNELYFYCEYAGKGHGPSAEKGEVAKEREIRFMIRPIGKDPRNSVCYVERSDGNFRRIDRAEYLEIKDKRILISDR